MSGPKPGSKLVRPTPTAPTVPPPPRPQNVVQHRPAAPVAYQQRPILSPPAPPSSKLVYSSGPSSGPILRPPSLVQRPQSGLHQQGPMLPPAYQGGQQRPQISKANSVVQKKARLYRPKREEELDPMDPAAYSECGRGNWKDGLGAEESNSKSNPADVTASGPLFQQRPYPSPGDILRRNAAAGKQQQKPNGSKRPRPGGEGDDDD